MSFFPPAIFEIKAVAGDAIAKFKEVNKELGEMENKTSAASGGLSKMDKASKMATASLLAIGAASVGVAAFSVKAAMEVEESYAKLSQTLTNVGVNTEQTRNTTEKLLSEYEKLGFQNEKSAGAFSKLIVATGNTKKATDLLSISADFARLKHIGLEEAAGVMAKATQGSARAFKEMGISLDATLPKNQAVAKAFDELQAKIGGQAVAYTKTFKGQLEILGAQTENLGETIGTALIPKLISFIEFIRRAARFVNEHKTVLLNMAYVIGTVIVALTAYNVTVKVIAAATKTWTAITTAATMVQNVFKKSTDASNKAMKANPIGLVVTGLMLLGAAFVFVWNRSETFRKVVIKGLQVVINGVGYLIGYIGTLLTVASKIPGIGDKFKGAADAVNKTANKVREFSNGLDKLSNKKISLGIDLSGPKLKDGTAGVGDFADITGQVTGGDTKKGGKGKTSADSSILKTIKSITNKLSDVQKTYTDKMESLQKDYAEKSIAIEKEKTSDIASAQTRFNETMGELNKRVDKEMAKAEKDYSDRNIKIKADQVDALAKLEKQHKTNLLEISQNYSEKLASIIQQSMDRLRDAFSKGTETDVGKIFKDLIDAGSASADTLITTLKDKFAAVKSLAANAAALQAKGFSQTFIEQVVASGPEVGNQLAKSILAATPESQKEMSQLFTDIETISNHGLDTLAATMNNKGKLATDELNQMYANANGELAVALAKENQAYADSSSELMKDFNKALTESQQQYYSAQAELTVRFDEDMAQAEKTRTEAFASANAKAADAMIELQKNLVDSQAEARKSLADSLDKIQREFDDKLEGIKTKVKGTVAEIKALQAAISEVSTDLTITNPSTTPIQTYASSPYMTGGIFAPSQVPVSAPVTVNNSVQVETQTNASPYDISSAVLSDLKYNTPIIVRNLYLDRLTGGRLD